MGPSASSDWETAKVPDCAGSIIPVEQSSFNGPETCAVANRAPWRAIVSLCVLVALAPTVLAVAGTHGRHGHHQGCRNGQCVPHCPVRPGQFGYHGTEWRRWPGTGVVPVSAVSDAVPVRPPRSVVPGPDEESPRRLDDDADPNPKNPAAAGPRAADPPVFELPAAPPAGAGGAGDGAQVPLPLDFRGVDARPTDTGVDGADGSTAQPRGWRQFLEVTAAAEDAAADGTGEAAADGVSSTTEAGTAGSEATGSAATAVAPVAFFPPRPPAQPQRAGNSSAHSQRAAAPVRGR
jgi:hypothetical protein